LRSRCPEREAELAFLCDANTIDTLTSLCTGLTCEDLMGLIGTCDALLDLAPPPPPPPPPPLPPDLQGPLCAPDAPSAVACARFEECLTWFCPAQANDISGICAQENIAPIAPALCAFDCVSLFEGVVGGSCEALGPSNPPPPPPPPPPSTDFRCGSGETVVVDLVCDGDADCADGSDEVAARMCFECNDGSGRIPPAWVCDGEPDCDLGRDEQGCP
jgi:hypothetical protein